MNMRQKQHGQHGNLELVTTTTTTTLNITGVGSIVSGLGFWLGKDILGFFKNIDLDNS